MNRRAFTLIELLTVIALIGILSSILLPALSKAKGKAQQAICKNDAKQWALAMLMYGDEHDDGIPRENAGGGDKSETILRPENGDVWYNALAPYARVKRAREHIIGKETAETFYETGSLFCCPSAKPLPETKRTAPRFSRGMNARLMDTNKFQRVSSILAPSITVAFAEIGVPGEKRLVTQEEYKGRPHVKWDHSSIRHQGSGNVSFFDGSAESFKMQVLTNRFTTVIRWTPDGTP